MADEVDEWRKLSTYDQVQHKNWKCRKMGYEALHKELEKCLGGEPLFKKYSVLVKKFVTEQNELSRMVAADLGRILLDGMETKDASRYFIIKSLFLGHHQTRSKKKLRAQFIIFSF